VRPSAKDDSCRDLTLGRAGRQGRPGVPNTCLIRLSQARRLEVRRQVFRVANTELTYARDEHEIAKECSWLAGSCTG